MLTEKAKRELLWGWIPTLGKLLEEKQIPDHYFGPTSVSDNDFKRVQRLMTISILIRENRDQIAKEMRRSDQIRRQLCTELETFAKALEFYAGRFYDDGQAVREIR